jgi:hypothetical protein
VTVNYDRDLAVLTVTAALLIRQKQRNGIRFSHVVPVKLILSEKEFIYFRQDIHLGFFAFLATRGEKHIQLNGLGLLSGSVAY